MMPSSRPSARLGITEARQAATAILADLRDGHLLDPSFERRTGGLDARDRRWLQELVYGMLRRRGWIDAVLADFVRGGIARVDADLVDLLRLGAYQLLHMGSVPAYAAIAQTVELAKRRHGIGASKLANAILRRIDRERDTLSPTMPEDPVEALAVRHSHPAWLVARWVERWGMEETERLLVANAREAPLVARPWGVGVEALAASLATGGVVGEPVPLVPGSLQLPHGVAITELGAFRQGQFFVQDPAATLVATFAAPAAGARVADLCAAPGGKALELARVADVVVAGDRSASRMRRVAENVARLDAGRVIPVVTDAREPALPDAAFDLALVDVPCTGTGTFRRHPDARWRLRISDLAVLGVLQRQILRAAAALVRPGGLLVYSTCSLEPEENDDPVNDFLASNPDFAAEGPPPGTVPATVLDGDRLRVLPQRHGTDGAFAARLRRVRPGAA